MYLKYIFIALMLPVISFGQVVTVSEPLQLRNDAAYHLIGNLQDHILVLRDQGHRFEVQAFDQHLRLRWNKELALDEHRTGILDVIPSPVGFDVLYRHKTRSETIIKLHKYDAAANLLDSATIKNMGTLFFNPNYDIILSENKRKLLLFDIDRSSTIQGWMIDLDAMQLMWEIEFEPDDFTRARNFVDAIADDNGNMYVILEQENRKSKREEHHFRIFSYGMDIANLTQETVHLNNHLTFDVAFRFDNLNKNLIAGGLYAIDNFDRAEGYYYLSIPILSGGRPLLSFEPFKLEEISALVGKQVDENKGVPELQVREMVLRRDGGIILMAESTRIYERQTSGLARTSFDRFSRYIVDYYYDEVFIASIHPDGSVHWEGVLHKKQYSQDDSGVYSSFFLMKTPTHLRLIFNDEIKNENTVSEYLISPTGQLNRHSIFSTVNQNLKLRFRNALQISGSEIIIPSEWRNRLKLVRVSF